MPLKNEFSFDICDSNAKLPRYILGDQFYSYYIIKTEYENNNHSIYNIKCSIERDFYLNNYNFYLKYNKEKDYYILNDKNGNTIENVYDEEYDYSFIEEPLINNILINICGHIPKLYFGDNLNKVYSIINKYLNNRLEKINKIYKNELEKLKEKLQKNLMLKDIKIYDINLYSKIQQTFIILFIKLDNTDFKMNSVIYKIKNLKMENLKLNNNLKFKISKKNLKINNVKYLN